jgi:hypothetical protein
VNKNEKQAVDCICKMHEQMKLNIEVIQDALKIMGMSCNLLIHEMEKEIKSRRVKP